jgi:16S rRNA C1402 N4-methylase RsmH
MSKREALDELDEILKVSGRLIAIAYAEQKDLLDRIKEILDEHHKGCGNTQPDGSPYDCHQCTVEALRAINKKMINIK